MSESQLKAALRSGNLSGAYFLFGDEKFLIKTYAERIISLAVPEDTRDMNLVRYSVITNEDIPKTSEIADILESIPFMSEYKCVLIEDLNIDAMDIAEHKAFLQLLENIPEGSILIIAQNNIDIDAKKPKAKTKKVMETCAKFGKLAELCRLPRSTVVNMAVKKLTKAGCTISQEDAAFLADECGLDLTMMQNELEKLSAYKPGGEITRGDIEKLVPKRLETNVYDLAKQLIAGRVDNALRILDIVFIQRVEPVSILFALSGHFTDLYRARLAMNARKSAFDASAAFAYPAYRSFVMKYAFNDARYLKTEYLADCIAVLYDTNRLLNSSNMDKRILIERAVIEIANIPKN